MNNSLSIDRALLASYLRQSGLILAKALLYLMAGYVAGRIAHFFIFSLLRDVVGIDKWIEKKRLKRAIKVKISWLGAELAKWYVYISFWLSAAQVFGSNIIAKALQSLLNYYPRFVAALALILIGSAVAEMIRQSLKEQSEEWAAIISSIIYLLFILSALQTFGVKIDPILFAFQVAFASFFVTLAIALGIGLGLAIKDELKPIVKELRKRWFSE